MHMASVKVQPSAVRRPGLTPGDVGLDFLAGIPMLASLLKLPEATLRRSVSVTVHPLDSDLYHQNDAALDLLVLTRGQVILTAASFGSGDDEIIDIVTAVSCFGEEALLGGRRLVNARVLAGSRIVAVDASVLPGDNRLILDHLYRRQRWMVEEIAALKSLPPAQRLARLLLSMIDGTDGGVTVRLPALKKVIARKIGVDPCTLSSRVLPRLKAVGVTFEADLVEVGSIAALAAFSQQKGMVKGFRRPERRPGIAD
ncbi:putative Transcriptional regulator, Crp/Fnr family [Candidatus Terasakiella magnetica]|nr:putative Transcriptional regulator, Crp/Fnr family [Candidatus Terasakiella magnetica]